MRLPRFLKPLTSLARWKRVMLEALLIIGVVVAIQLYQTRGLPEGVAPPLEGLRTDGSHVKVPAGTQSAGATGTARPTLVVFWSVWCPVCKAEEGNIVSVAEDWPVLSVAMQSGDAAEVSKRLKERGIELPALVDSSGAQAMAWNVRGVPTHFVVDAAGKVRFRVVGYATTWGLKARLWWAGRFPA